MDIRDVSFRPGQRQLSAAALNAMAEGTRQALRAAETPPMTALAWAIQAQADIASGGSGSVVRCYWDAGSASFATAGEAFTAANLGPSGIRNGEYAVLVGQSGNLPAFAFSRPSGEDPVDHSSSSASSASESTASSVSASSVSVSLSSASSAGDGGGVTGSIAYLGAATSFLDGDTIVSISGTGKTMASACVATSGGGNPIVELYDGATLIAEGFIHDSGTVALGPAPISGSNTVYVKAGGSLTAEVMTGYGTYVTVF